MKAIAVDASVVAAAVFPQAHSTAARVALLSGRSLHAPALLYAEVANVIWKRARRGEVSADEAEALFNDILDLPIEPHQIEELAPAALQLAILTGQTVYDCLYIALAVRLKTSVVSGDRHLVNALARTPLEQHVEWIGGNP